MSHLVAAVHQTQHSRALVRWDIHSGKLPIHQLAVVHQDLYLPWGEPYLPEKGAGDRHQLGIRLWRVDTQQVDIPLEELARAPFLRALIAPEWAERPPAGGKGELALALDNHARQGGGELGSQGNQISAAVGKDEGLLFDQLFAGAGCIQLERFQERTFIFLVAVGLRDRADLVVEPGAHRHLGRVEVACAFEGLDVGFHVGFNKWLGRCIKIVL